MSERGRYLGWYVLDENNQPVPAADLDAAGKFMEDGARRRVAETTIEPNVWVSTVFIGLDHGFGCGPPQLFETMVFTGDDGGDDGGDDMWRYSTWEEAKAGHEVVVAMIQAKQEPRGFV